MPLIITLAPTAPLIGLKLVIVGVGNTVKLDVLSPGTPFTETEILPVIAPAGTITVRLVVEDAVTRAATPLNVTLLLVEVALKLVPVKITVAPTAPLFGVKSVIVGVGTMKLVELLPVIPLNVTEIGPVVAPTGTVVVILVVVEVVTTLEMPLNFTVFSDGTLLKLVPEMVTVTPYAPLVGLNPVIEGVPNTVKFDVLLMVTPLVVTEIGPVPAPKGTEVVILVEVDPVTTAATPLNFTTLFAVVKSKLVPVIVTVVPLRAPVGLNPVIVGVGKTVKLDVLYKVTPLTVTEIFPDVAPAGTVVVMLFIEEEVTTAVLLLLNLTITSPGVLLKLEPEIMTVAPTAPLTGLKPDIVGVGITVNVPTLKTSTPLAVTASVPVVAPAGTIAVMLVAEEDETEATVPLIDTVGERSKLEPLMITVAPTAPLVGVKLIMVGVGNTLKSVALVMVIPLVLIDIFPVDAPVGTVTDILVALEEFTMAATPLKVTDGVEPKLEPLMEIVAPMAPLVGEKFKIVGVGSTVKIEVVNVIPFTSIEISPVVAPEGTLVSKLNGVNEVGIEAEVPLNDMEEIL